MRQEPLNARAPRSRRLAPSAPPSELSCLLCLQGREGTFADGPALLFNQELKRQLSGEQIYRRALREFLPEAGGVAKLRASSGGRKGVEGFAEGVEGKKPVGMASPVEVRGWWELPLSHRRGSCSVRRRCCYDLRRPRPKRLDLSSSDLDPNPRMKTGVGVLPQRLLGGVKLRQGRLLAREKRREIVPEPFLNARFGKSEH